MKGILAIVGFILLLTQDAKAKSVCGILERTPRSTTGTIVELEAWLAGGPFHGYMLFDLSSRSMCKSKDKDLPLRPILRLCWLESSRCPPQGRESELAAKALNHLIDECRRLERKRGFRGIRVRLRGILVYPPDVQVFCEDDVCWGSGFGDGSIAASILPLSIQRLD